MLMEPSNEPGLPHGARGIEVEGLAVQFPADKKDADRVRFTYDPGHNATRHAGREQQSRRG
jgi:hypothetical protein